MLVEVKRLEHSEDNSSLSSAEIESCICLPPYAVLAFTHNIMILLFYIVRTPCRFERRGARGRRQTPYDIWCLLLLLRAVAVNVTAMLEYGLKSFPTILKTSLPAFYCIN
jgi:hypothetical protein